MTVVIVLCGVMGCGKTTCGRALVSTLGADRAAFHDGDDFHPQSNKAKMASGQPLSDQDRAPWLESIAAAIRNWTADNDDENKMMHIIACSALKVSYRALLRREGARFVLLHAPQPVILARLLARRTHEFIASSPARLLDDQYDSLDLQPPPPFDGGSSTEMDDLDGSSCVLVVDVSEADSVGATVEEILRWCDFS